jgi:DNA-binding SARP family transcriptional activator
VARLSIALLGSYRVTLDGVPLNTFATDKVRALLAYLVVESERAHRREELAALLWPDSPRAAAHTSLRQALYRLRGALGDQQAALPHLLLSAKEVQLNPASDHWLDVVEFEAHIVASRAHHPHALTLCPDCVARLAAAVKLYRGDFLAGFTLPGCEQFDWWQLSIREASHHQALDALTMLAIHCESRGEYDQLIQHARRKIDLEPWSESAHRRYMRALASGGQRAQALRHYQLCCRKLAQEMGVGPSAETQELYEQIRSGALPGVIPRESKVPYLTSRAA